MIKADLGDLTNGGKEIIGDFGNAATGFVNNTSTDMQSIFQGAADCLATFVKVGEPILVDEAIEYHTTLARITLDHALLPASVIGQVWQSVAPSFNRPADPHLWYLTNPKPAMDGTEDPSFQELTGTFNWPSHRRPLVFVSGMGTTADPLNAFYQFFQPFEAEAGIFRLPGGMTGDDCDVYILSYNADLTRDENTLILDAFLAIGYTGDPVSAAPILAAVGWRDLERRASQAGDYLTGYFKPGLSGS